MMQPEWWFAVFCFLGGAVTTALIRELVSYFFERPRPYLRILDIALSPSEDSKNSRIEVDYQLRVAENRNPILPKLDPELTIEKALAYIVQSKAILDTHESLLVPQRYIRSQRQMRHVWSWTPMLWSFCRVVLRWAR